MQILPGIYLLCGFAYQRHQNFYGIDLPSSDQLVLIDCGLDAEDFSVMEQVKKSWHLEGRRISKVFITHSHFDHAGNASILEQNGAGIFAGKDSESLLSGNDHTIYYAYQRPFPVCKNVTTLEDGQCILLSSDFSLTCHYTPGHTAGSVCYELCRHDEHIWFTGDFIQPGEHPGQVRLGIKVDPGYDYTQYLNSMKRVKDLPCSAVLPGHYSPCLWHGNGLFQAGYRELLVGRDLYR